MSTKSGSTASSEQNTVQYANPYLGQQSANTSMASEKSEGSRQLHYPSVCVQVPRAPASQVSTPPSGVSYAIPFPKPIQYSATQLHYENMKHRCKMLDSENQRLMRVQNELITDANRRVEMHVNEIRMLKEDNKKLATTNKELRDLCCYLDDDRQKTRRLAREWQKFGRYSSQVMKQEMSIYQQRLREAEERHNQVLRENEELKQLCLYLDEQRQRYAAYHADDDKESEDLGCGSSERSEECDDSKDLCDNPSINQQKEHTLRMLCQRIGTPADTNHLSSVDQTADAERLVNYIHSLEGRIKQLERASQQTGLWHSACTLLSESDEKTIIDRCDELCSEAISQKVAPNNHKAMQMSSCSTMTTSGTTYASSETDMESAVYVMGDEIDEIGSLEVRSLTRIEEDGEDKEKCLDEVEEQSAQLPPAIAPLSESLLNVGRLSLTSSDLSLSLNESTEEPLPRCSSSSNGALPTAARVPRFSWKGALFRKSLGGIGRESADSGRASADRNLPLSCTNDSRCGITAV
ncbi:unnamed protein product [Cylicocyclus nassatus]|uniref:Uncharacterized protein n=1 Tax=Cylicocyclus nassatus TaxID=53992 RepID=A0AA36GBZ0_CYLNA|nr:unnamed protein product [Cylicocyclus nassatus]